MKDIIKKVPIPTAGVALGLAALGILLQPYSEVFHVVAGVLSICMVALLAVKIIMYPRLVKEDLNNAIAAGVLATLFMTIMQLSTYLAPYFFNVAFVIWCVALIAQVCYMVWFTAKFMLKFDLKQVFPTNFIAYVGIIVAALTSPAFGMEALGTVIFWFGFVCYLALLGLITYRYAKHEVPEPAKPLYCIYAAPMSLSLAGYLSVAAEPSLVLVIAMIVAAQLFLVLVLTQLPKILRLPFYPSYAAMTFPFVVSATALTKATAYFSTLGASETLLAVLGGLAVIQTILGAAMVLYVFGRYMHFFFGPSKKMQEEPTLAQEIQKIESALTPSN